MVPAPPVYANLFQINSDKLNKREGFLIIKKGEKAMSKINVGTMEAMIGVIIFMLYFAILWMVYKIEKLVGKKQLARKMQEVRQIKI